MTRTLVVVLVAAVAAVFALSSAAAESEEPAGAACSTAAIEDGGAYRDALAAPLAIPDSGPTVAVDCMFITSSMPIAGFSVELDVSHTFVGDLEVTVGHQESSRLITLLERPRSAPMGVVGSCSGDDISVTFSDLALTPVTDVCGAGVPSIEGFLLPIDPLFVDGETIGGSWTLTISDKAPLDTGTLDGWALIPIPIIGDADCSASVNAIDAALILQFAAQLLLSVPCPEAASVNGDSLINAIDAALILQFAAGLIPNFAVG